MPLDLHALLQRDDFALVPDHGHFDVEAIAAFALSELPGAWRDPQRPQAVLVFGDDDERAEFLADRAPSTPDHFSYPVVMVVDLQPQRVTIDIFAGEEFHDPATDLTRWIEARFPCHVASGD
ncbi:hypothetical protein KAK06_06510 [Ideonella sp. 4Y11]|uniref:Uncharacterized protein n=1 Tax=Ideonella aquatica TaxID=2824119 RepID=A0A940YE95_9BURK|nr:hypothetical protein [Ideonella aquatica]MBQ0958608.1 hypothetical protein [Ideonella aquatica]